MTSGRQAKRIRRSQARAFHPVPSPLIDDRELQRILTAVRRNGGGLDAFEVASATEPRLLVNTLTRVRAERRRAIAKEHALLPPFGHRLLCHIPPADFVLSGLNASWNHSDKADLEDIWSTELRTGLDNFIQILWLLRNGLTTGAVVACRHFLERWTFNVASHYKISPKASHEETHDYITRVWLVYPSVMAVRNPGKDWQWLSELLHGREVAVGSARGTIIAEGNIRLLIHNTISRIAEFPLLQVRGGISVLAADHGMSEFQNILSAGPFAGVPIAELPEIASTVRQIDYPFANSVDGGRLVRAAHAYRRHMTHRSQAGYYASTITSNEAQHAFLERFGRRIENALLAYAQEEKAIGSPFDFGHLGARLFRYIAIADMARLVGAELAGDEKTSLLVAADALEASWNLWLEDYDLSLPAVRVLLEQTARARTHRIKPSRATRLEARGAKSSPTRWLEGAGWSRLSSYTRALGEFSHISDRSRIKGARRVLTEMQKDDTALAPHGARREALNEAAYMLAHEVASRLDVAHPLLAFAFRDGVTLLDDAEHEEDLIEWLNRAQEFRTASFGTPDYSPH